MQIFLFILGGKPGFRSTLHEAQAVLEDHLRSDRDVTDVWWDDEQPLWARKYLYGASHSDFEADGYDSEIDWETTDQLIWPVTLPDGDHKTTSPAEPLPFGGVELSLILRADHHKEQILRVIPEHEWSEERLQSHIVLNFAVNAGQSLADRLNSKERT